MRVYGNRSLYRNLKKTKLLRLIKLFSHSLNVLIIIFYIFVATIKLIVKQRFDCLENEIRF